MKKIVSVLLLEMIVIYSFSQIYNSSAAADYAREYCDKINPAYNYYSGKDCANFVSQCLKAGGLNLSLGAYGVPGGTGEVDNKGCIKGATELLQHLKYYQDTKDTMTFGYHPFADHVVGDPMFRANDNPHGYYATHSFMCSSVEFDSLARRLYSTHTADNCDAFWPNNYQTERLFFLHINSALPKHCTDCKKNYGEEEIDCGGTCPPCEHAPEYKSITTPTSNLPSEVRATKKITAGSAAVKVLSGQNVDFITAGEIELLPGFEVEAGGNFNTQMKGSIYEVTAHCGRYCDAEYYPNPLVRYQEYFRAHDLVNVDKVEYEIRNLQTGAFIHSDVVYVTRDGVVELWDLVTGESSSPTSVIWYIADLYIYTCRGGVVHYTRKFLVQTKSRSSNEEFEETGKPPHFSPPNTNNTLIQSETTVPYFSIIPNPNLGVFQLETNFPLSDIGNLKITNLMGVSVFETQHLYSNTIQLQTTPAGTYFVVMILKDGTVLAQKMIVQ